ncbi:MAG: ribosome silencing factor [Lachnospiraceae bacterium]|nr:ribosome silencing factor [Lachnospiraceae bacterium]
MNLQDYLKCAYEALDDKKGENIKILQISELTTIADYMIITNGNSPSQVKALADNVDEKLHLAGIDPRSIEGARSDRWVLMDYGDIIIHIFSKDDREFYNIERIWSDAKEIEID